MAAAAPDSAAALVTRLRARDGQAWDELYQLYEPRLTRFAYRLTGNPHDAADLVQETFLRVLPRLDRLDPATLNLSAYLFTTAKNLFLKQTQARRRLDLPGEVPEPDTERPIEDEPERLTQLHRQQEEVRAANAALPPRQRLVLALRELEERSYAEIGEIVGLNENAVAQLISRARDNLRHELRLTQVDRSRLSQACQALLPALSAHLDGRLKPGERERVLDHLGGCDDCQAVLGSMEEARRRYRTLLPPLAGAGELKSRIDGELDRGNYWRPPRRSALHRPLRRRPLPPFPRRRLALGGAAAAAAVTLAVAGYVLAGAGSGPNRGSSSGGPPTRLAVALPASAAATTATPPRHRGAHLRPRPTRRRAATTTSAAVARDATTAAATTLAVSPATSAPPPPPTTTPTTAASPAVAASAASRSTHRSKPRHAAGPPHHHHPTAPPPPTTAAVTTAAVTTAALTTVAAPRPAPAPRLVLRPGGPREFSVANTGTGAAAAFSVRLSDGTSFAFSDLAPGASASRSFACAAGRRTATIDPASEAGGGGASIAIPACPPSPSLAIVSESPTGFTVANNGSGAAGHFSVVLSDGTSFRFAQLGAGDSAYRSFACAAGPRQASISPAADAAPGTTQVSVPACPQVPRLGISAVGPTALTVVNTGTAAATGVTVTLSDGTSLDVGSLAPGASASESFTCGQAARTASISPAGEASASGEGVPVPACPPAPELTISAASATGLTVSNLGSAAAASFTVGLSDGTSFSVASLAPGATVSESFACAQSPRTASISPDADAGPGNGSVTIPVCPPPAAATLTLTCPGGGAAGAGLQASGSLTPALAGSTVTITYTPTRGAPVTDTVTTGASGTYTDTFTSPTSQTWTAQARFAGDSTRTAATSASCSFGVG